MGPKTSSITDETLVQTSRKVEGSGRNGTIRLGRCSYVKKQIKTFYRDAGKCEKA